MSAVPERYRFSALLANRAFLLIWAGQMLATLCMSMSEFSVTIWVYQHNSSVLQYASAIVFAIVPALLVAPFAGSMVDRNDPKRVMLYANLGGALCAASLAALAYFGQLALWHVYLINALTAVFQSFHRIAYLTSASTLVKPSQLGGANGMIQLAFSVAQLVAPVIAGVLLGQIGLVGVLLLEALGISVAMVALAMVALPRPPAPAVAAPQQVSIWRECAEAAVYLLEQRALLLITLFASMANFFLGMAMMLTMPMLLAAHSEATAGLIMSFCGAGMIGGAMLMVAWGGPRRLVAAVLGANVVMGIGIGVLGSTTLVPLLCTTIVLAAACSPVISTCTQTLTQKSVPLALRGRVFALTGMLSTCSMPAAALLGGLAADRWFEPAMLAGGALAGMAGPLIGVGKGRGIGLMFILAGAIVALAALGVLRHPGLRRLDRSLAHDDAGPDCAGTPQAPAPLAQN